MVNCSRELEKYWDEKVKLPQAKYNELKQKRDAQIEKLKANLKVDSFPLPIEFINQGSYAMKTLIQQDDEYDIDVGVVFNKEDLEINSKQLPSSIKYYIGQKLKDERFSKSPSVLKNCVRVNYKENYHIDMPVFRKNGTALELATNKGWESSNPQNINRWFQSEKASKPHLKKIVQLLKKWSKSRSDWSMTSGLILSILASECYIDDDSIDRSFYKTLEKINIRLKKCRIVFVPNSSVDITAEAKHKEKVKNLSEKLSGYFNGMFKEHNFSDKNRALKIWKMFFADNYFEEFIR